MSIALTWLRWALASVGYVIRPYDLIADERRWAWQPSTCCRCGRRHR